MHAIKPSKISSPQRTKTARVANSPMIYSEASYLLRRAEHNDSIHRCGNNNDDYRLYFT